MTKVRFPPLVRFVTGIAEITLGDDPKRADGRQRAAVVAIQLVPMVAVCDDLSLGPARQLEIVQEHVARIRMPTVGVALTFVIALAYIARRMIVISLDLGPGHVDLAGVRIAIARIEVQHGFRLWEAVESGAIHGPVDSGSFGSSAVEKRAIACRSIKS